MKTGFLKSSTPTALNLAIVVLALLTIFTFGIRTIGSGNWWTHLANGRIMATDGGVPEIDQLSFTEAGEPVVAPSWLYDKIAYWAWEALGPAGTTLLHAFAVLAAFIIMIPLARRWCDFPAMAMALLLSAWLISFRFNVSPSLFVLIFPAVFLLILSSNTRPVYLWTIIPLCQWLWTNISGSFMLGPVLCLLMALQAIFPGDEQDRIIYRPRHYLGLGLLCFGITFINPYGLNLHSYILSQWNNPSLPYANEWISPFASQFDNALPSALLVITLVIGAAGLITYRHKLPLMLTIVVALVAFLAVRSMRFIEIMAVLAFPFICLTMQASISALDDLLKGIIRKPNSFNYIACGLALLISVFTLWSIVSNHYYSRTGSELSFGLGIEESAVPEEAVAIIGEPDFPNRAINLPLDGGYLAWRLPERKIFIDSRSGLYGIELYHRLSKALWGDEDEWRAIVDANQIDGIIIPCAVNGGGKIVAQIKGRKDWTLAYFDGTTAVFLRNKDAYSRLLDNERLQSAGLEVLAKARQDYLAKLESDRRIANSVRLIGAGNVFYALGNLRRACAIFDLLTQGSPNMTGAWMFSGIARARMGGERLDDAVYMIEEALSQNAEMPLAWGWLSRSYEQLGNRKKALEAYENAVRLDQEVSKVFSRPGSMQ